MTRAQKAEELFKKGFNCSQSVFAAFADLYGFDEETALKISASFGGGFARMREICGCVSGMAMVAGLETGSATEKDAKGKEHNYEVTQHLAEEFKKVSGGSIICAELLGLRPMADKGVAGEAVQLKASDVSPKPSERTEEYYKKRPCIELVKDACNILEKELLGGNANE